MRSEDNQRLNRSISHGDDFSVANLTSSNLPSLLDRAQSLETGITIVNGSNTKEFLSYAELAANARCILAGLRQQGLQPQDQVILYLQSPQYFFASLWGCWLGGFVPIPLGVELNFKRTKIEQVKQLANSSVIIADSDLEVPTVRVEGLLTSQGDRHYHHFQLDDLALLLFTSGSTGKPKGVMLSPRNLLASVYGMAKVNSLSPQDISLNWMPVEHVASLVMFHLTQIYLGCQQIQVKSEVILQNPLVWLDLIDANRVTATWSPNFAYSLVNEQLKQQRHNRAWNLSCLRWMGNGAEAVVGQTTRRFVELLTPYGLKPNVVSPGYGMSETTSGIAHNNQLDLHLSLDCVSVGTPIPGVSLRIVDRANRLVPVGTEGLLQVKGDTVTAGYYQQPELNQETFTPDGWFNTGDLGFLSAGQLTITGRQKDTIIINGVNFYNHDLETVVESIAGVNISYTAACGVKDSKQQEQIAIFLNTSLVENKLRELINQIRKALFQQIGVSPAYIIPVTRETIPKTAIGKIQRSQLVQRFAAGKFDNVIATVGELFDQRNLSQQELPGSAIEKKLVGMWQEVLNTTKVGVKDNFFELGGNSLLLMQVLNRLTPEYSLSAVDLFQYPTIAALANYLSCDRQPEVLQQGKQRGEQRRNATVHKDVAIIGMSCRFPGANNLDEFWDNLCNGVESISFFEDEEILDSGVDRELLNHPDYVKASPILEDITGFDADFWGYSPKEAQLLDPQQRLFLECAWESLEDAGYDPFTYQGNISLYGGAATNTYLLNNIYPHRHTLDEQNDLQTLNLSSMGGFQVSTANDKDYLTTRTSYKLNLTGSSVNVQTACSTSLVTVHLACQSLISCECDLALAGGVSVHSPQKMGYLHQEGMILSADGHCRAFDAAASGTIFGSGAGMVVLKLLDKAIADGDRIYGVIKGSAVNNDGGEKVGYFAPNVDGQTRVVAEALAYADTAPESVSYIEAHGTGTKLGDPIEVTALAQAYQQHTRKVANCAMGSVKTNVGHLQMASGIVGLIKAVLCLERRKIVPSLHFKQPNPQINWQHPFYINTQLQDWETRDFPRRAGVNSLGIGGTNAHVILEEFIPAKENCACLPSYLLTLSAKNEAALQETISNYLNQIETAQHLALKDICFTSNIGRHHFDYRLGVVASSKAELVNRLKNTVTPTQIQQHHKIAWLFTGQGSQYAGMARQLYNTCTIFRANCDRCMAILQDNFPATFQSQFLEDINVDLNQTQYAQPLLFTIEYSLAQLWLAWGIKPDLMLGHSIGEYVAATIAGVFSLADTLKLVGARGKLMQSLPKNGAMLAVFSSAAKIDFILDKQINIAADNGTHLVLSGLQSDIDRVADKLESIGIETKSLSVAHAFHSPLMEPVIEEFRAVAQSINYALPQIPIVSNLTGTLANETIATADYWVEHILKPVQFAKSIRYLERVNIFLEIGTKPTLIGMANSILDNKTFLHSLNPQQDDWQNILATLAQLYTAGLDIDWQAVTQDYNGQKISLPTYPFQRQRYWFDLAQTNTGFKQSQKEYLHPLIGQALSSPVQQTIFQAYLKLNNYGWLLDHCLENEIIFPGTGYLEMAVALGLFHFQNSQLLIENIELTSPLYLNSDREIQLITSPQQNAYSWEVHSSKNREWQLHASGQVSALKTLINDDSLSQIKNRFTEAELNVQQHYLDCQQKGINYGKSFQGIKQLWAKGDRAFGLIELPSHLDSQAYHFHPALLDACLQILFAALPKELQTNTYLPVGVEKLSIKSFPGDRVWSYLKLKSVSNDKILTADVWLYSDAGELIAQLEGLKSQAIKSQPAWHDWLYQQQWIAQPLLTQALLSHNGTWLIFADSQGVGQQVATQLKSQQQCQLVTRDNLEDDPQAFQDLIQQHPQLAGVIYCWSLDRTKNWQACKSYLYLVQALIQHQNNPSLYFLTQKAQPVNDLQTLTSEIGHACLWGMQKAIALEHPELTCIGIDLDSLSNQADNILAEICAAANEQVAYRNHRRYVARLARYDGEISKPAPANLQLQIETPGNLDSLQWQAVARQQPQANEIEIAVKATGLNFRDVMVALDLYPDETKFLGLECTGVVTKVGTAVANFKVGDAVIAISDRSFSQYLTVNSLLAIPKPRSLSYDEAATIPVTFLTAYYTLVNLAQLQPGSKILIHAAAGGVGLAAIQIAQNIGAEIYATASEGKWSLLKSLGVRNIMNSRSLDFAEEIISATNGAGVDVVLNSLSGEFIARSLEVTNEQGCFIEIGKQGIWSDRDVARVKPNIDYSVIDLWQITQNKPELIQQMLSKLLSQFTIGKLKPLLHTIFDSNKTIDAFRYMQQGKHQGKIIIAAGVRDKQPDLCSAAQFPDSPSGTYLIAGGMGAIGLQVAEWLITKGVNSLVLMGRNQIKASDGDHLKKLQQSAQINFIKADISSTGQLSQALLRIETTLPPLKGVIHCAGVKCDRAIANQDWQSFSQVLAPKVRGAWNLHCLTQKYELESFILFSSAASLIGSAGQANYCAANAFLDVLAHARRSLGLKAIAINWSVWENTGLAADPQITAGLQQKGIGAIEPQQAIAILDKLLSTNLTQIGVIPIDWHKYNYATAFHSNFTTNKNKQTVENLKQQLLTAAVSQRKNLLMVQISQQLSTILGIKNINKIDSQSGFSELGLDSLGSVELRNKIQSNYSLKLSPTAIFDRPNIKQLAEYLLDLLFDDHKTQEIIGKADKSEIEITSLSDIEAEELLLSELKNLEM